MFSCLTFLLILFLIRKQIGYYSFWLLTQCYILHIITVYAYLYTYPLVTTHIAACRIIIITSVKCYKWYKYVKCHKRGKQCWLVNATAITSNFLPCHFIHYKGYKKTDKCFLSFSYGLWCQCDICLYNI